MKERPILFSATMVRAILDGSKTQTRRVVKPQPHAGIRQSPFVKSGLEDGHGKEIRCPYGQPGDRLWVRETFSYDRLDVDRDGTLPPWYWANGNPSHGDWSKPRPSIHMPRWASRIALEITGVRVERLNEISEQDAMAEGVEPAECCFAHYHGFSKLWESINGAGSWQQNPWVWVVEFKRVQQ